MRVRLDTNVIVSALISKGFPSSVLEKDLFEPKIRICLSAEVLKEYQEVLARPKFSRFPAFVENSRIVLNHLRNQADYFSPVTTVDVLADKSDNKFLELALISKATYLVTGNTQDFILSHFEKTQIITPRDFIEQTLS